MTCTGSSLVALLTFVVIPILLLWVGYIVGHGRGEVAGYKEGHHDGDFGARYMNESVRPARDEAAIELLKTDPDEYFRRYRRTP